MMAFFYIQTFVLYGGKTEEDRGEGKKCASNVAYLLSEWEGKVRNTKQQRSIFSLDLCREVADFTRSFTACLFLFAFTIAICFFFFHSSPSFKSAVCFCFSHFLNKEDDNEWVDTIGNYNEKNPLRDEIKKK